LSTATLVALGEKCSTDCRHSGCPLPGLFGRLCYYHDKQRAPLFGRTWAEEAEPRCSCRDARWVDLGCRMHGVRGEARSNYPRV
jgi:hypothetical protein